MPDGALTQVLAVADCFPFNRNRGCGTRALIDGPLYGRKPVDHAVAARSHNAVATEVEQLRDYRGVAIAPMTLAYCLDF